MSYLSTFEAPIVIKISDKDVSLYPLTQRDYLPWLAELTESQRKLDRGLVPATLKGQERFALLRRIEMSEIVPADLEPIVFTAAGTIKVISMAIAKALKDNPDAGKIAEAFIDSRSAKANEELAARVSGLFDARRLFTLFPPDHTPPEDVDQNPPRPATPQAAGESTGS